MTVHAHPKVTAAVSPKNTLGGFSAMWESNGYRTWEVSRSHWDAICKNTEAAFSSTITPGTRVALHADNSPTWVAVYVQLLKLGATVILIPPGSIQEPLLKTLQTSSIQVLCTDRPDDWYPTSQTIDLKTLAHTPDTIEPAAAQTTELQVHEEAELVFVDEAHKLHQFNAAQLQNCAREARSHLALDSDVRVLSLLPFSNIAAQTCALWLPWISGCEIATAPTLQVADWFRCAETLHPTHLVLQASQLDYLYRRIQTRAEQQGRKAALLNALDQGKKRGADFRQAVFRSLLQQLGGRLQRFVCIGVPDRDAVEFFLGVDIHTQVCYGSADSAPILSMGSQTDCMVGSIGRTLASNTLRVQTDTPWQLAGSFTGHLWNGTTTVETLKNDFSQTLLRGEQDPSGYLFPTPIPDNATQSKEEILKQALTALGHPPESQSDEWIEKTLRDIGLDSMQRLDLLLHLERITGSECPEDFLRCDASLEIIARELHEIPQPSLTRFPYWPQRIPSTWLRELCVHVLLRPLLATWAPTTVEGLQHVQSLKSPVLFAANHLSHADTVGVISSLPYDVRRRLAVAAWKEYYFHPSHSGKRALYGRLMFHLNCLTINAFPLSQEGDYRSSFRHMGQLVDRGWHLLIYPEGRRSDSGKVESLKPGIARIQRLLRIPIVPMYLENYDNVLHRSMRWPKRHACRVVFGEAFLPEPGSPEHLLEDLHQRMIALGKPQDDPVE